VSGSRDNLVKGVVFSDLGRAGEWGLPDHAQVAARALQPLLSPAVVEPIRGHVTAKRYRVAVEPAYHDRLSLASQMSLVEQGGPLSPGDASEFAAGAFAAEALRLTSEDLRELGVIDAIVPEPVGGASRAALPWQCAMPPTPTMPTFKAMFDLPFFRVAVL